MSSGASSEKEDARLKLVFFGILPFPWPKGRVFFIEGFSVVNFMMGTI